LRGQRQHGATLDHNPAAVSELVRAKLFGPIEVTRLTANSISDSGSITLTAGRFLKTMPETAIGAMVNAGPEVFVQVATTEMERAIRVDIVSLGWVAETLVVLGRVGGGGTPVDVVVSHYIEAIEGFASGNVYRPSSITGVQ
jgi:hypothetical protein